MKKLINQLKRRRMILRTIFFILSITLLSCNLHACLDEESANNLSDESSSDDEGNSALSGSFNYFIVGTNQSVFYNNNSEIEEPALGESFYGQDATYFSNMPDYTDNGDGTISDNNTGLMWQKTPGEKITYDEAVAQTSTLDLGAYTDWRLPTIKELYSLIIFSGIDPSGYSGTSTSQLIPFIDTDYFDFEYGNPDEGERIIDSQFASSNLDVGDSEFGGGNLMFGVNFADGRIKGYPSGTTSGRTEEKTFFVLYVRGNETYGINNFVENDNETISDEATGLMWMKNDSGEGMTWKEALEYAENLEFGGYTDWRLPNIKELQSIVDYTRAPSATQSAAIDPVFNCTQIVNEAGQDDFPYFWSGTTHCNIQNGGSAAYISFGRALGYSNNYWQDVHGAGAQRSDPKIGDPDDYPTGHGPQGDAIRIYNFVRCVRNID